MKNRALVVCFGLCVAGCGTMVNVANNVVMKGGQWEYVVTPNNGSAVMDFEANVPETNLQFNGQNASIFFPSQVGATGPNPTGTPIYCAPFGFNGDINGNAIKAAFDWGDSTQHFASFSGELAPDGQSLTNGAYSGQTCSNADAPGTPKPNFKGTLTGQIIAPVNGTFTGTLQSSAFGADVVTFTITQNADFSLNIAGTSVENGVTTMFASAMGLPENLPAAVVTGATVGWGGTATNVNGSQNFQFNGHLNPTATQLTATFFQVGPGEMVTGTLTRQ